ncbi:MAG TPA: AlpA family phage regulatory protein [Candidatus Binataceae bacterium]|jgi:predicted DNA-binding transcriptional regulator AlpA|nr:AlpA family phage regulatory protein [Candidatus Binataceae bacterium]
MNERDYDQMITQAEVEYLTSASRTTIWRWCRAGIFPSPVRIGVRRIGWSRRAVEQFLAARPAVYQAAGEPAAPAPLAAAEK